MTPKSKRKAVLFDLDDTIFDHRHCRQAALTALAQAYPSIAGHELRTMEASHERHLQTSYPVLAVDLLRSVPLGSLFMRPRYSGLLALCCLFLTGCSPSRFLGAMAPDDDQAHAVHCVELLQREKLNDLESDIDPSLRKPGVQNALARIAMSFPRGTPTSRKLVGVNFTKSSTTNDVNLTYEYDFSGRWLLVNVAMRHRASRTTLVGFHVTFIPDSLEHANRFTFQGKGRRHFIVFAMAVLAPLLTIYALVRCVRLKLRKWKWLWLIFIIFGFGMVSLNWTTGQYTFRPLAFEVLSTSAFQAFYGPWTLSVAIPIGAIAFLIFQRRLPASVPPAERPIGSK